MIEFIAAFIALTALTFEYFANRKSEKESVCKVWVQENRSTDWICVDRTDGTD